MNEIFKGKVKVERNHDLSTKWTIEQFYNRKEGQATNRCKLFIVCHGKSVGFWSTETVAYIQGLFLAIQAILKDCQSTKNCMICLDQTIWKNSQVSKSNPV
jgi:alpha-N-acetylglucosamine transferase